MQTRNCYFLGNFFGRVTDSRLADEHLLHFAWKISYVSTNFTLAIKRFTTLTVYGQKLSVQTPFLGQKGRNRPQGTYTGPESPCLQNNGLLATPHPDKWNGLQL